MLNKQVIVWASGYKNTKITRRVSIDWEPRFAMYNYIEFDPKIKSIVIAHGAKMDYSDPNVWLINTMKNCVKDVYNMKIFKEFVYLPPRIYDLLTSRDKVLVYMAIVYIKDNIKNKYLKKALEV